MHTTTRILLPLICAIVLSSCAAQPDPAANKPQKREAFGKGWEASTYVSGSVPANR
jgi:hypothetical protein